jgi:hypothetical protein
MIQTGRGTAEIQLISGTASFDKTYTIIKMAENTSILFDQPGNNKETTLELLYGRARVVTGTSEPAIVFRAGNSLTTLQNCDTVLDYIARPGLTQPVLSLHCFYGQGEIIPRFAPGTETAKFPIRANETCSIEYRVPYSYVERKSLDTQILAYYNSYPFTPGAPLPVPEAVAAQLASPSSTAPGGPSGTAEIAEAGANKPTEETGTTSPSVKPNRHKINVPGLITGFLIASGGAALQIYSKYGDPNPKFEKPLFYGGFGPEVLGTLLIVGALINPTPKEKTP